MRLNELRTCGFASSQFDQAIKLARVIFKALEGNVTFVGISKGGGLASAARFAIAGPGRESSTPFSFRRSGSGTELSRYTSRYPGRRHEEDDIDVA